MYLVELYFTLKGEIFVQNKLIPFITVYFIILLVSPKLTQATVDPDESFKKDMKKSGYVSVEEAITKFEVLSKHKIMLPQIPFLTNYDVGLISKENYLKLQFINTNSKQNFSIFVKESKGNCLYFANLSRDKLIKLKDGTTAFYNDHMNYYRLAFIKDNLEYCYIAGKDNLTKLKFIKTAESFKYNR